VINAYTGAFAAFPGTSGDSIYRLCQVRASDLSAVTYPGAQYFMEGLYVGTDDAASGNSGNNATYKRVLLSGAANLSLTGPAYMGIPAIRAWRDHGLGANVPDLSVTVASVDVPGEGRFYYANKVRDLGNGTWRYEYAVYNLSSDRSGGSFSVPVPTGAVITNIGFNAPFYHSGELYSNSPWVNTCGTTGTLCWNSPQTYAQNINTNALRWGTMYNFWFDANAAPTSGNATLGLFKPGTPGSVSFAVQVPVGAPCYPNCDNSVEPPVINVQDFTCFLQRYAAGDSYANRDNSNVPPMLNVQDFTCFLQMYSAGCP
jgi:hypothetical protein